MSNPYVFILGCPRSGTTLLQRIVNAHPRIAIAYEAHWIAKFFERHRGVTRDGMITEDLIPLLLAERTFTRMRIGPDRLRGLAKREGPVPYSTFVTELLNLFGQSQGKLLVGDKWPNYALRINTLNALWQNARFVHLIRDGRDAALSLVAWKSPRKYVAALPTWRDDALTTAAVFWESTVRRGREDGQRLGPKLYYELRHESLLARPREECEALCDFLAVPYDEAMLRFHEARPKASSGRGKDGHAWMPLTPGLRDWRTQMGARDLERFEAAAARLLGELGYPRAVANPRPESLAQAERVRNILTRDSRWSKRFGPAKTPAAGQNAVA